MVGKAKGYWKHLWKLGKIVPRSTEIVASYAEISSSYSGGEGNTANSTTKRNYIYLMYMLESVSNIYKGFFGELHNETYWSPCHESMICPDPKKKRSTKGHPIFSRIHTKMDIQEPSQPKRYFVCCIPGYSKKNCPHCVDLSQQR
ncbi:hypothetical protein JHK87_027333 [Glycine soja]|nr:hypothetical protein JHK87_027333 [Glycine soja]